MKALTPAQYAASKQAKLRVCIKCNQPKERYEPGRNVCWDCRHAQKMDSQHRRPPKRKLPIDKQDFPCNNSI